MRTIYIYKDVEAEVEVEITFDDIIEKMDDEDMRELIETYGKKDNASKPDEQRVIFSCKSLEDASKIELLEKAYYKYSLVELENKLGAKL